MRILGYLLIIFAAALFAAPISPIPKLQRRVRRFSVSTSSKRAETLSFITMLADQLRIGASPSQALVRSADAHPLLVLEIHSGDSENDNLLALRRNVIDGSQALLKVALFFELSSKRGTPLIPALDAIVESIENEIGLEEELHSEVAGARATATLMSMMPILILLVLHPYHFIFGTDIGRVCITASVLLNLLGRLWLSRITKNAMAVTS